MRKRKKTNISGAIVGVLAGLKLLIAVRGGALPRIAGFVSAWLPR